MQNLHLVGFTTDRRHLIFSARKGAKSGSFSVPVDDELLAAIDDLANDPARSEGEDEEGEEAAEPPAPRAEPKLSVREVQARLRTGESVEAVASDAGVEAAWVERFAPPVRAEQRQIVDLARELPLARPRAGLSDKPLGIAVAASMAERGITFTDEGFDRAWSARLLGSDHWIIEFTFVQRGRRRTVAWTLDLTGRRLTTSDRTASQIGFVAPAEPQPRRSRAGTPGTGAGERSTTATEERSTRGDGRPGTVRPTAEVGPAGTGAAKKAGAKKKPGAKKKSGAKKAGVKKKAGAKKAAGEKTAVRKSTAKKKAAGEKTAVRKSTAKKKSGAKKAGVKKKAGAKKAAGQKTAVRKSTAKKKAAGEKTAVRKSTAKKKAGTEKTAARKTAAKKKASGEKAAPKKAGGTKATRPDGGEARSAATPTTSAETTAPTTGDGDRARGAGEVAPTAPAPAFVPTEPDDRPEVAGPHAEPTGARDGAADEAPWAEAEDVDALAPDEAATDQLEDAADAVAVESAGVGEDAAVEGAVGVAVAEPTDEAVERVEIIEAGDEAVEGAEGVEPPHGPVEGVEVIGSADEVVEGFKIIDPPEEDARVVGDDDADDDVEDDEVAASEDERVTAAPPATPDRESATTITATAQFRSGAAVRAADSAPAGASSPTERTRSPAVTAKRAPSDPVDQRPTDPATDGEQGAGEDTAAAAPGRRASTRAVPGPADATSPGTPAAPRSNGRRRRTRPLRAR